MQYILSLNDENRQHLVVFTLRESDVKRAAGDFFFDIVANSPEDLSEDETIPKGQVDDLTALQHLIFDQDKDGIFIRNDKSIWANGKELDPDAPLKNAFVESQRDGVKFMICDAMVRTNATNSIASEDVAASGADEGQESSLTDRVDAFARIFFIWRIANGYLIDVTKEDPSLIDSIAEAEKHNWIEIDVQKAAYKLTAEGQKMYAAYKAEAQDLIKRYDIYGDVDVDYSGSIRFDTGLGRDLRIPIFEIDRVDPFRARFLIGLSDGDFDSYQDWPSFYKTAEGYEMLLRDVSYAPSLEELGRDQLKRILDAGKAQLRVDGRIS